jgi:hypothetical protein
MKVGRIEIVDADDLLVLKLCQQVGPLTSGEVVHDSADRLAEHPDSLDDVPSDRHPRRCRGVEELREAVEELAHQLGLDRVTSRQVPLVGVVDELVGGDIGREAVDEAVGELEQLDVHAVGSHERAAGP